MATTTSYVWKYIARGWEEEGSAEEGEASGLSGFVGERRFVFGSTERDTERAEQMS
jgi:hypothetical protein